MHKRKIAIIALLLNTLIWGAALPIVKPALDIVTPYQYLFYRYLIAIIPSTFALIFLLYKYRPSFKTLGTIVAMEFLAITVALSFLYEGLSRTSAIEAGFIANASPIFIIIGGILFLKEKEEFHELAGLTLAIVGITILTLEPVVTGRSGFASPSFLGNLVILGHNMCWTYYILRAKKLYKDIPKTLISFVSVWVGFISFGVLTLLTQPGITPNQLLQGLSQPSVLWAAVYMGILGSIIAVPAMIIGNNLIEASEAALFAYLQPLVYVPLAIIWLKEPVSLPMIAGILLISFGVIIAEKRSTTRSTHGKGSHRIN